MTIRAHEMQCKAQIMKYFLARFRIGGAKKCHPERSVERERATSRSRSTPSQPKLLPGVPAQLFYSPVTPFKNT
jgi:hypothetical protein